MIIFAFYFLFEINRYFKKKRKLKKILSLNFSFIFSDRKGALGSV